MSDCIIHDEGIDGRCKYCNKDLSTPSREGFSDEEIQKRIQSLLDSGYPLSAAMLAKLKSERDALAEKLERITKTGIENLIFDRDTLQAENAKLQEMYMDGVKLLEEVVFEADSPGDVEHFLGKEFVDRIKNFVIPWEQPAAEEIKPEKEEE